jgi:hypothetical protein
MKRYTRQELKHIKKCWSELKPTSKEGVTEFDKLLAEDLNRTYTAIKRQRSVLGLVMFTRQPDLFKDFSLQPVKEVVIRISDFAVGDEAKINELAKLIEKQGTLVLSKINKRAKIRVAS